MSFELIKERIDRNVANGLPEAQIIIHKDGKEVFRYIAGFSDAEKTKPARYDDLFWLFSMTKVFTMTAALRLVERGELDLDEPLDTYLKSFKNLTVRTNDGIEELKSPLTLRRLMSMTGGYSYNSADYPEVKKLKEIKSSTTLDIVNGFALAPLKFQPGTRFNYSYCHDIVAGVIEAVGGKAFGEFIKTELLDPLGITDMGFHWSSEQLKRMAQKWSADRSDGVLKFLKSSDVNIFKLTDCYESGGAGLFGNAEQYIKLADALANGGVAHNGYRVLSPESIELMRTNQLGTEALAGFQNQSCRFQGYGYGLGVRTVVDQRAAKVTPNCHEFGWDGAAGSYVMIDPVNHITVVYIQHIVNHSEIYLEDHLAFRDITYKALGL